MTALVAIRAGSVTPVSRPIHFNTVVRIIVRKRYVLLTKLKSEEITTFCPIFLYILALLVQCFLFANFTSGCWAYLIGDIPESNFFFRYPRIGTILHWRDTGMENLLPTLP